MIKLITLQNAIDTGVTDFYHGDVKRESSAAARSLCDILESYEEMLDILAGCKEGDPDALQARADFEEAVDGVYGRYADGF